ncbi:1-phosphofructokinase family hexose kinase [Luxibacter massiliensis]|uniref:1-phosphofructokinase family hexose kinase n=1 Tax=Luxibacter massiliensis TaxID=2219695 RepID=UPI000F046458|nr:PfkB family carbohydrate kinase [Luxibacter massiliensis]
MGNKKFFILNMNPGYDQWHLICRKPAAENVYRSDEVLRAPSGKGLNTARLLHRVGYEDYVCINILGGGTGRLISELARCEGLHCREYPIQDESRINTCVTLEYGQKTISYNAPGPVMSGKEAEGFTRFLCSCISQEEQKSMGEGRPAALEKRHIVPGGMPLIEGKVPESPGKEKTGLVISGAPCRGISLEWFQDILGEAALGGQELFVDISGEWLKEAVEFPLQLLKVNREEFKEVFHVDAFLFTEDLKRFKNGHGIENLIVTDGKNGCIACGSQNTYIWSRIEGMTGGCYAVGSGDSFLGGYLACYGRGLDLKTCVEYGNACGLANTFQLTPAMINKEDVEGLLQYVRTETVGGRGHI